MPANNTNQSMLRGVQGGSPTSQAQNQRAQMYTRNNAPNTAYNTGGSMYGMNPRGGQYGNQQANLGRYVPPTMQNPGGGFGNPDMWRQGGGYAYNIPNAYGQTGIGYMGGFDPSMLQQAYNPFMQGGYGPPASGMGQGGVDAQRAGQQGGMGGQMGGMFGGMGGGGGLANNGFMQMLQQYFQGQQNAARPQMSAENNGGFGMNPWNGGGQGTRPQEFIQGGDGSRMQVGSSMGEPQTNIPARSNMVGNPLLGGQRGNQPLPVDTWNQNPQPPQQNRAFQGFIDPNQGSRQRTQRAWGP